MITIANPPILGEFLAVATIRYLYIDFGVFSLQSTGDETNVLLNKQSKMYRYYGFKNAKVCLATHFLFSI